MKQLHKQASLNQHHQMPIHSAKPSKPLPRGGAARSAASYLLREQRLLFVLVGALLASSFFLLRPSLPVPLSHPSSSHLILPQSSSTLPTIPFSAARRVPASLKQRARRVVVTGGAGFVGSHLVDKLLARGDSVIVVDNFFTGRKENLVHHFGDPRHQIAQVVQKLTKSKNIRLKTVIDPSLVAGFTIRFGSSGSKLIDMSVKKHLDEITAQLDFSTISFA